MDLIIVLFTPPILAYLALAFLPAGPPALAGCVIATILCLLAALAIFPIGPASGPDDWFHGIEVLPFTGAVIVVFCVSLLQAIRWYRARQGKETFYWQMHLLALVTVPYLSASIFYSL